MPQFCIYLELEEYLRQWLVHELGDPVKVPRGSQESDILELCLTTQPKDAVPDLPAPGKVAIVLPQFRDKDTRYYNYLPPRGRKALARCIYVRFRVKMWEELHRLDNTEGLLTDMIYAWMEAHGIECCERNWETIRQMYFRKRKVYRKLLAQKNAAE